MRKLMCGMLVAAALVLLAGIVLVGESVTTGAKKQDQIMSKPEQKAAVSTPGKGDSKRVGGKKASKKKKDGKKTGKQAKSVNKAKKEKKKREKKKKEKKKKEKKKKEKPSVAYVGDSILHSLMEYDLVCGDRQRVIAKIGLSPFTFYNNEIMDKVLEFKADRIFIMLGMNAIEGDPGDRQIRSALRFYQKIIEKILKNRPKTELVVLPVPPVRPDATADNRVICDFNRKVKRMAADLEVDYYDYTPKMRDRDGCLREEYAEADGMHWKKTGCERFLKLARKYKEKK